jgi:hypothetical protein
MGDLPIFNRLCTASFLCQELLTLWRRIIVKNEDVKEALLENATLPPYFKGKFKEL